MADIGTASHPAQMPAQSQPGGFDAPQNGQSTGSHMPPPPLHIPQNTNPIPTAITSPMSCGDKSGGLMSPAGSGSFRRAAPEPNKRALYVGGLDQRVTEDVLRQIFETTGHVQNVKIIPDKNVRAYALCPGGVADQHVDMTGQGIQLRLHRVRRSRRRGTGHADSERSKGSSIGRRFMVHASCKSETLLTALHRRSESIGPISRTRRARRTRPATSTSLSATYPTRSTMKFSIRHSPLLFPCPRLVSCGT